MASASAFAAGELAFVHLPPWRHSSGSSRVSATAGLALVPGAGVLGLRLCMA